MGKLGSAKVYGGVGAILMLIGGIGGIIPFIGFTIVGLILLFIAVKYVAEETRDESIFKNYLFYFMCNVIAIVAAGIIIFLTIGGFSLLSVMQERGEHPEHFLGSFAALIGGLVVALIIAWVLLILAAIYLRKSYNRIAKHTGVDIFRTTGTIYFIGAVTLIILVGALIIFVAKIMEIIAFFSLPENLPSPSVPETPPPV